MTKGDYVIVAECASVIKNYQQKIIEISNLELDTDKIKKEINEKINKMKDPLGDDFVEFQKELNIKNCMFNEMIERKKKLTEDLITLRDSDKELMNRISKMKNKDQILEKVMVDADVELKDK